MRDADMAGNEIWDLLDAGGRLTGRTHRRGEPLADGDFHLVARAWIRNARGEYLITRRALTKVGWPGVWEVPSGSAVTGEDSLTAAIREAREESGVVLSAASAERISSVRIRKAWVDSWLFRHDFDLRNAVLQEGETDAARAATLDEIGGMMARGAFISAWEFPEFSRLKDSK